MGSGETLYLDERIKFWTWRASIPSLSDDESLIKINKKFILDATFRFIIRLLSVIILYDHHT